MTPLDKLRASLAPKKADPSRHRTDTKAGLTAQAQDYLDRFAGMMTDKAGKEVDRFFRDLFARHYHFDEKTRGRPYRLRIGHKRELFVVYDDGSTDDVSWRKCINPPSHRTLVLTAARRVVNADHPETREASCSICGGKFTTTDEQTAHAITWDHDGVPFSEVWTHWLAIEGISEDDIALDGKTFADDDLKARWRAHHLPHGMSQRAAHGLCNVRKGNR